MIRACCLPAVFFPRLTFCYTPETRNETRLKRILLLIKLPLLGAQYKGPGVTGYEAAQFPLNRPIFLIGPPVLVERRY